MTRIGKLLPDGTVRFIECRDPRNYRAVFRTLLTFYSRESRLDALLDLGDVAYLGPSPYGKWNWNEDYAHCQAQKRDNGEKSKKYLTKTANGVENFFDKYSNCLLHDSGKWKIVLKDGLEEVHPYYRLLRDKSYKLAKICAYMVGKSQKIEKTLYSIEAWCELQNRANETGFPVFAFRGERMIATIIPKTQ